MEKIGIFYGSTTGTTEDIASRIGKVLGVSAGDIHDVGNADVNTIDNYDCLLLGSSTWGSGELQDDWYDFIEKLKKKDLTGKKIGFFGCGDSDSYPNTFCDALRVLYDDLQSSGCIFIGSYKPENYSVTDSLINKDGEFVGLAIDEVNESDKTDTRIQSWAELIKAESK